MSNPRPCPQCGAMVPANGNPHGLCPQCLLKAGLETRSSLSSDGAPRLVHSFSAIDAQTRSFGDYELLEEIARGGMGVVAWAWSGARGRGA